MTNPDATIAALRAALAVDAENLPLRLHLAAVLSEHGRDSEATDELRIAYDQVKAAISQRPADPQLYEQLADVQHALGDEIGALTSLGIATALRGVSPAAEQSIGKPIDPEPLPRSPLAQRLGMLDEDEFAPEPDLAERPDVTFADVGGMAEVKERIRMAIIYPLQQPDVFAAYGKRAGGGLLLYGPPGCGKTYLARATAGEVGARFLSIGISDILDMWYGQSEQKLHALFESARRARPAVLFFDEIDAIGGSRLDMRQQFQRTLVNQFLAELDGADSDNDGILVIGATNAPWHVDVALRRPGRFDHIVFVAPPDEAARREILRLHLRGKPAAEDVDVARLARETERYSGADLRALVDGAAEVALQEALRSGKIQPLSTALLLRALRDRKATTVEWLSMAKNYALYSNEGGLYDDV
ncbi:MAG TPA: ATP-binding protein, partial [Roseiflexaceae bacterium]|nr:ATP-binding protein [Roseiflexaceae bacterium]